MRVLHRIANSYGTVRTDERFNALVSKVYREGKKYAQQALKKQEVDQDRALQATTGIVQIQRDALSATALPPPDTLAVRTLNRSENCYICKKEFHEVHFFYHLLCPKCAEYNFRMRGLTADLSGRTALVTGGRVKIGFQTVLRLLRDGARVIVTTRFPNAAARRFYEDPESGKWADRLQICGLDLRNIPAVESFARHLLDTLPSLDIVIHNAAQTVRRPHGFYQELIDGEMNPLASLPTEAKQLVHQAAPSTLAVSDSSTLLPAVMTTSTDVLPANRLEDNEERADSRDINSWLLKMDEVDSKELLEVQLVNSIAPFVLNSRLKPLMLKSPFERRFIVNVSAMEGQFARHKTVYHPHTNMAKAALNMMTRTSGDDYARDRIYMNSVDTGWVTDENPTLKRNRLQDELGFFPPLDIIDGMARIYHPIAFGINNPEEPLYGQFLKDYAVCPW